MTSTHATRALRAAVFTALAVPMAALGQVVITGRPLPLSLVATASAVVFLVSAVLAGGERRLLHISAVMVPVELLLNTTFNLGQTGCGPVLSEHVSARGVNLLVCGGGSVDGSLLGAPLGHAGQLAPAATQLLLLLVHLVIALAASAWLRLGDSALSGLTQALRALRQSVARPLRALLVLLLPAPVRPVLRVPLPVSDHERPRREDVVLSPAPRRGPPVLAPAC